MNSLSFGQQSYLSWELAYHYGYKVYRKKTKEVREKKNEEPFKKKKIEEFTVRALQKTCRYISGKDWRLRLEHAWPGMTLLALGQEDISPTVQTTDPERDAREEPMHSPS